MATRNADAIAKSITTTTGDALRNLQQACWERAAFIRARISEIAPGPTTEALRRDALAAGKLVDLDAELQLLLVERGRLDDVEAMIVRKQESERIDALRRDIPRARRELPSKIAKVRAALDAFKLAAAALSQCVDVLAKHHEAGEPFPLTDEQCAELYVLRQTVWTMEPPNVIGPPGLSKDSHPQSFDAAYTQAPDGTVRPRGRHPWPGDYGAPVYRN